MIAAEAARQSRVLIVEAHVSFREALAYALDEIPGISVAAQAGSLAEARENSGARMDVVLMDLELPDGDGIDLIREIHRSRSKTGCGCSVIVLSSSRDRALLARAVEAGAACVMHKSVSLSEVMDVVQTIGRGEIPFTREARELLRFTRDIGRLTRREHEVLRALAEGLDNAEIARRLRMTIRTERAHMVHILNKLGAHSRLQALVTAVRSGVVEIH